MLFTIRWVHYVFATLDVILPLTFTLVIDTSQSVIMFANTPYTLASVALPSRRRLAFVLTGRGLMTAGIGPGADARNKLTKKDQL